MSGQARRKPVSPHRPQGPDVLASRDSRLMRLATYAAVGTAGLLIVVKAVAWLLTDSVAMLSTLVDSLLDAAASLINLYAVHQALQPADREHRFAGNDIAALGPVTHVRLNIHPDGGVSRFRVFGRLAP